MVAIDGDSGVRPRKLELLELEELELTDLPCEHEEALLLELQSFYPRKRHGQQLHEHLPNNYTSLGSATSHLRHQDYHPYCLVRLASPS
jgi:hypothetical protein